MQVLEQDQTLEVMQEAILDVNQILEVANMHEKIFYFEYLFLTAYYFPPIISSPKSH